MPKTDDLVARAGRNADLELAKQQLVAQIGQRRFANAVSRQAVARINDAFADIVALLAKKDPATVANIANRRRMQLALDRAVAKILNEMYADLNRITKAGMADVAELGHDVAVAQLRGAVAEAGAKIKGAKLGRAQWLSIAATSPVQGLPTAAWWRRQKAGVRHRFRQQLQVGLTQGETIDQLVRRVRGRSIGGGRYEGGIMATTTREATALVRTGVNQIMNRGAQEAYLANDDVTEEYEYVATLDSRTTPICRSLDGKKFRHDDAAAPRPPQHWNCRSFIAPVVNWEALGLERPPGGERAAAGQPVPEGWDYSRWLREQPASVQDEILGRTKGKLFRQGKVSLEDLVRSDGSEVTLEELRRKLDL